MMKPLVPPASGREWLPSRPPFLHWSPEGSVVNPPMVVFHVGWVVPEIKPVWRAHSILLLLSRMRKPTPQKVLGVQD